MEKNNEKKEMNEKRIDMQTLQGKYFVPFWGWIRDR